MGLSNGNGTRSAQTRPQTRGTVASVADQNFGVTAHSILPIVAGDVGKTDFMSGSFMDIKS